MSRQFALVDQDTPDPAAAVRQMLDAALSQVGDQYDFGAEVDINDPDPQIWDCAELTKWAAHRADSTIPGSSYEQYLDLKAKGLLIPVDQAERTAGALLFHFSQEPQPGAGRPAEAHVAISLGDGRTVEARGPEVGVVTAEAGDRFEYAALLPGVSYEGASVPADLPLAVPAAAAAAPDVNGLTSDSVIYGIKMQESHGDYTAENPTSTASGAYQYIDATWDGYGGFSHASDAPPEVQDQKMRADTQSAYARLDDWERVIAAHFAGEDGQAGPKSDWGEVPGYEYNHNPSIREYVDGVKGFIRDAGGAVPNDTAPPPLPNADAPEADQPAEAADAQPSVGDVYAINPGAAVSAPEPAGHNDILTTAFYQALGEPVFPPGAASPDLATGYTVVHTQTMTTILDGTPAAVDANPATGTAPAAPPPDTVTTHDGGKHTVQHMLDTALAQQGDTYFFGAAVDPNDPDPSVFDCSKLTEWAARQAGVDMPDTSYLQYLDLKEKGLLIPVDQAARTPGALLFHFSSEPVPGGGRPSEAHVALSLGDGRTIEAYDESHGVDTFDMGDRFNYAALVLGLDYGTPAVAGSADTVRTPDSVAADTAAAASDEAHYDSSHLTVEAVMRGIMMQESGGDYTAQNPTSSASGAYQYIDATWDNYAGYAHAKDAPPGVQDEKMRADTTAARDHFNGDWERVIAAHFAGEGGQAGPKTNWNTHPGFDYNQNPSIWEYVNGVLDHIHDTDPAAFDPPPAPPDPAHTVSDSFTDAIGDAQPDLAPGYDVTHFETVTNDFGTGQQYSSTGSLGTLPLPDSDDGHGTPDVFDPGHDSGVTDIPL